MKKEKKKLPAPETVVASGSPPQSQPPSPDNQTPAGGPARKGHFSTVLWILLTAAVCWWLGGSAADGESSLFHRLIAALTNGWTHVALNVAWAVLVVLAGITAVYCSRQISTVPRMTPIDGPAAPTRSPAPRDSLERQLQALGFRYLGDFDVTSISSVSSGIRAYGDPDHQCAAVLLDMTMGGQKTTVLQFGTSLHPSASITTSTSALPSIYSYPTDKMLARVPWKETAYEAHSLHQMLCRTAREENFWAQTVHASSLAETIRKEERRSLEHQVQVGRLKRVADDQYRPTLLGTVIAVPLVWWQMCYGPLFSWIRIPDGFFCWKLRRRLRRLTGESLDSILARLKAGDRAALEAYPLAELLTIFLRSCDAIATTHSNGTIHGNLKPESVVIRERGNVGVTDWGMPKSPATGETATGGAFAGTPCYMAPEQALGSGTLDERTDIYSLGAVLYAILTLQPPVTGKDRAEILQKVASGTIETPTNYARKLGRASASADTPMPLAHLPDGAVPESLSAVAMKALARDPAQRHADVKALQKEVEAYLDKDAAGEE